MKTYGSMAVIDCLPAKRKSEGLVRPVSPCKSGKGLPYAPVDWPNPGDIWSWSVGSEVKASGFFCKRFLYAPKRLQEKPTRQLFFQSKPALVRYLQSVFPEADINAFFASFTWEIPAEAQSSKKESGNVKTYGSMAVIDCLPAKRKSEGLVRPVSPCKSGKGLPYAPVDWPNPGDIWGWSVGSEVNASGFFCKRFLYAPKRLQEKPTRQLFFQSKPALVRYLQSVFPEADINAFFASFTWEIPAEAQSSKKESGNVKTYGSLAVIDCLPAKRKSEGLVGPVSPCKSGKGLPYAPVDWPNPGDIWGWSVGSEVKASGFFCKRFLYAPKRLQEKPTRQLFFQSKPALVRYLQSVFPEADINAFFASFTWEIPAEAQSSKKGKCDASPQYFPSEKAGKLERIDGAFRRTQKTASKKRSWKSSEHCVTELALEMFSAAEQTLESNATTKSLGSSQPSDSGATISPDATICLYESQTGLTPEDFDSFLNSLDGVLSLPLRRAEISCSASSHKEDMSMTETRTQFFSLVAMGFASLAASNKLNELTTLASKLQNDPTLNPGQLSMLKLIQEIPLTSYDVLKGKKLSEQADKFFAELDAKLMSVASLKEKYIQAKKQLQLSQAEEASTLLTILEIDEEIADLKSRRAALSQKVKVTKRKIAQHSSCLKKVMECLPKIVHEVRVANSEKQEWELKKKKSAEQVSEILAKLAPPEGFSF